MDYLSLADGAMALAFSALEPTPIRTRTEQSVRAVTEDTCTPTPHDRFFAGGGEGRVNTACMYVRMPLHTRMASYCEPAGVLFFRMA